MQNPETSLTALGIELRCAVDGTRPAVVDKEHRVSVNWETFFFAGSKQRTEFEENLIECCGLLTDPVTGARFRPHADSPLTIHEDRRYFFSSDSTRVLFEAMPDSLANPDFRMTPRSDRD